MIASAVATDTFILILTSLSHLIFSSITSSHTSVRILSPVSDLML